MKMMRVLVSLAILALPIVVSAGEPARPATPAAAVSAIPAPPGTANLLGAIFADSGLPCTQLCFVSRDCGCDPPVIVACTGCQSCSQAFRGVRCDGVTYSCPPCAL
jgi:hypothetical protein